MRCEWNNCFSNVQTNITLAFSSPYSSTITTSATSDAIHFGDEVRRKFESTTQCCRIRDKLAKDTIATHSSKFATECKPYRCQWVEFRRQDDCFCAKNAVPNDHVRITLWCTSFNVQTATELRGYGSRPYMHFPVFREERRGSSRASLANEPKFQTAISPKRLDGLWYLNWLEFQASMLYDAVVSE